MNPAATIPGLAKAWQFGVLGIEDYRASSKLDAYFGFLRDRHRKIPGDVCEVDVFRGRSLLATALLLREIGSEKKVIGFDSFTGFPGYDRNDELDRFADTLHAEGRIGDDHLADVEQNRAWRTALLNAEANTGNISSSGAFSEAPLGVLMKKIELLGLENIELVEGDFAESMAGSSDERRFCAVLLDCDLYRSHRDALPYVWDRLSPGGFVFLDEYYSLKFPGARIAIDEFFAGREETPVLVEHRSGEFERWGVFKGGGSARAGCEEAS